MDTLWFTAGKSCTNHSKMTKDTLPESLCGKKGVPQADRPTPYSHSSGGCLNIAISSYCVLKYT